MEKEKLPDIPRDSPEVALKIGKKTVMFSYENTTLYTYHEPYAHMSHVYHIKNKTFFFASWRLLEELQEFHYPEMRQPYPNADDTEAYVTFMLQNLDNELKGLQNEE